MTRYLLMPFSAAPLILVAVFAVLWSFAIRARFMGIPADLILVSWFFKYCYALLDAVVAGKKELPVLSVEMVNPVDEQRPLFQAIMVACGFIVCWWLYHAVGRIAGFGLGALFLTALPATVGLLAMSDSAWHALSPLAIGRVVTGLGLTYISVVGIVLGGAFLIGVLALTLDSMLLTLVLAQLVLMAMFCCIGGAIFENQVGLQLNTRTHEEMLAERDAQHHADARAATLDRSYALLRLKRTAEAWANLEPWIRRHCPDGHPFGEYHALQLATCSWDNPAIGDKVTNEYLRRLLAHGETGMALDALSLRLQANETFYPANLPDGGRLTQLAALAGRKAMSRQLAANAPENSGVTGTS